MLPTISTFTGGSSSGPPKSKRQRARQFYRTEDGGLVDSGILIQQQRQAQREAVAKRKAVAPKRKGKEDRLNYHDMANAEYFLIRKKDWYEEAEKDLELDDQCYWCAEQEFIYKDVYTTLAKPIRPMAPIDLDHLSHQEYFEEAYNILDKMGLLHLMTIKCNYNEHLILQFYSTVVFCKDEPMTIKWMTGLEYCESTWPKFAEILGYEIGVGRRLHSAAADHDKNQMDELYGANGIPGTTTGLLPLYAKLVHLLRDRKSVV